MSKTLILGIIALSIVDIGEAQENAAKISLNTLGYLPQSRKVATINQACKSFEVVDLQSPDEVAYRGHVRLHEPSKSSSSSHKTWLADFSELQRPGQYALVVPEVGKSPPLEISSHLYNYPFYVVMRGMYLWRCGCSVAATHGGQNFAHAACHLQDGSLDYVGEKGDSKDGVGGWHDAGDYNKYTGNGAFAVGMLLQAWFQHQEILEQLDLNLPKDDSACPDYLAEVKWELDWLLKMQAPDGSAYHKLSTLKFGEFVLPEAEPTNRYFCPWSSVATADLTAVMAMASRAYQDLDPDFAEVCLAAAQRGRQFLLEFPEQHRADQKGFETGRYDSSDTDDRIWALAEIWDATGDEDCLQEFENKILASGKGRWSNRIFDVSWDWGNVKNLGVFTYLRSERPGRNPQVLEQLRETLLKTSDEIVATADQHAYGRPLGERYFWGANGSVARQAMNLRLAFAESQDTKYLETLLMGINYLLGRNSYCRSYVTGLGHQPPRFPHDRRAGGDDIADPWPGYLIGGPWPSEFDWHDDQEDFRSNEIAINWNAALIYSLAGLVDPETFAADVARNTP